MSFEGAKPYRFWPLYIDKINFWPAIRFELCTPVLVSHSTPERRRMGTDDRGRPWKPKDWTPSHSGLTTYIHLKSLNVITFDQILSDHISPNDNNSN